MADDQKLEVLEEEIKVLKGEVRRTLVDLRALVMRADSPLNDGSIGRRSATAEPAPEEAQKGDGPAAVAASSAADT